MEKIALIIFLICVVLFVIDRFQTSVVALLGCTAMVVSGCGTVTDAFSGFTNDIILLIFGTEVLGIAFQESGLSLATAKHIMRFSGGSERKIILIGGMIAALLSAFLNNQVISALMIAICMSMSKLSKNVNVRNITLPVVICVILGGQLTLVGAPATLIASSIAEKSFGSSISMFEMVPPVMIILVVGMIYMYFISYRKGIKIWGDRKSDEANFDRTEVSEIHKYQAGVTVFAGIAMIFLFITELVSAGIASLIAAIICIFGGAVKSDFLKKVDWNIIIWLGCSIGMSNILTESGIVQKICDGLLKYEIPPLLLLAVVVVITTILSNFIANTTTVIIILPFAMQIAQSFSLNPKTFLIAVTMSAGLVVLTPLSSGFLGMTMRAGYKFKDYVRYGFGLQLVITTLIILLTPIFYRIEGI